MFDLEKATGRWRKDLEKRSSLSPQDVDELEDHLRVRFDLEMELTPSLSPAKAFARARLGVGAPPELSREFAKAGKPGWRRLVFAGLALFAVSFVLPAYVEPGPRGSFFASVGTMSGWDAFGNALVFGDHVGRWSALTNAIILFGLVTLVVARRAGRRWLAALLAVAGALNLVYWPIWVVIEDGSATHLGPGYWAWVASFGCMAAGFWLRNREWASTRVAKEAA